MNLSRCYIALRDIDEEGAPVLPGTWEVTAQTSGWYTVTTPEGDELAALRCNAVGARGLFAVWGPIAVLEEIAAGNDEVMPAREAWRRAVAGETQPRLLARAWRWWLCDVTERDEHGDPQPHTDVWRRLSSEGVMLPDPVTSPLPWDLDDDGVETTPALAARRVTRLVRPVLPRRTLAGHACHEVDEPDRGA